MKATAVIKRGLSAAGTVSDGGLTATANINRTVQPLPDISIGEVETLAAGSEAYATMTGTQAEPILNLGIPQGEQGIQGEQGNQGIPGKDGKDGSDGAPGFSPIATVTKSGDTATISITDEGGTTTATITDGKDGTNGTNGTNGQDGFSPIASVSKAGDTATITITDANGTTTASVKDGANGTNGTNGQDGFSPIASVSKSGDTATITITDANGTTSATVKDGTNGTNGQNGAPGAAAGFGTVTASVDANVGTPSVSVTASGPDTAKEFSFAFSNLKGETGATGPQGPIGPDYDFIEDGRSSNTAGLVGTCSSLTQLKNGSRILYHLKYNTAASTTLNLTLVGGTTTGAKKVYRQGTTQLAASIGIAGCILPLTYLTSLDGGAGGWMMDNSYDSNTNTIGYQVRTNSSVLPTTHRTRYYRMLFTSANNKKWVPANTQYDNSATSAKTVNQEPINPFGPIVYLGNTTNYAADADIPATSIWQQYALVLGYSFNWTGAALTLTTKAPVYVKCAPQSDGSAIIDSTTPIVQTLPSTADGKIYIFLGIAYDATHIELQLTNPIYYYSNGAIRLWTNLPIYNGGVG